MEDVTVIISQEQVDIVVTPVSVNVDITSTAVAVSVDASPIDIVVEQQTANIVVTQQVVIVEHGEVVVHEARYNHAQYVEEAPIDGKQYARKDETWAEVTVTGGGGGEAVAAHRLELNPHTQYVLKTEMPPLPVAALTDNNIWVIRSGAWEILNIS